MADPYLGQIQPFGFNFAPRGWAQCNGQLLPINQNTALFSLLGTIYGGDGRTTFALPDLRGRAALHMGTGPGLSPATIGEKAGNETETLNQNQMPSHTHAATAKASSSVGNTNVAENSVWSKDAGNQWAAYNNSVMADKTMKDGVIQNANAGGGQAHNNMQPYLVVNWCIAIAGTFPSRN
jgi:microcystin-dependent protein